MCMCVATHVQVVMHVELNQMFALWPVRNFPTLKLNGDLPATILPASSAIQETHKVIAMEIHERECYIKRSHRGLTAWCTLENSNAAALQKLLNKFNTP